jgi:hypothetical protein
VTAKVKSLDLTPLLLLLPVVVGASEPGPAGPGRVRDIAVLSYPVFDVEDEAGAWPLRLANRLHVLTREEVIRRELLFAPGDDLDPERLAQTERNLRALVFLRDARVETRHADGGDGGERDVDVRTFDAWSTSPEVRFAQAGRRTLWSVGISEKNLLGRGQQVEISRRADLDREETFLALADPRLVGSRVGVSLAYSDRSDGRRGEVRLARRFLSLHDLWAFGARLEGFDQLDPLYSDGERVAELHHVARAGDLELSRAVRRTEKSALRVDLAYRHRDDQVAGDLRRFGILEIGLRSVQNDFVSLSHVNRFEGVEDFNLGADSRVWLGLSSPALGGEPGQVLFLGLSQARGARLGSLGLLRARAAWSGRHRHGRLENGLGELQVDYLNKLAPRRLLLSFLRYRHGTRLDPETQITLGVNQGLRGHEVRQWVGDRSLLLSSELRLFLIDDVLQVASFGAAAFVDSGYAWPAGQALSLRDLRTNVGVGLLVGRNRLTTTRAGVRFDLAYAFEPAAGRSRFVFSAGSQVGF